jgi:hypothetical protein
MGALNRALVGALALTLTVGLAERAGAATTVGYSTAALVPGTLNVCSAGIQCTYIQRTGSSDIYIAPVDGVIVRWRLASGSSGSPVRLRVLRRSGAAPPFSYTGAGTSGFRTATGGVVDVFENEHLPIAAGNIIGVDNSTSALLFGNSASAEADYFTPYLGDGAPLAQPTEGPNRRIELNADIEPDADGDAYGDETQDGCPANPARQAPPCAQPAGPPGDTARPQVSKLGLRPSSFAALRRGPSAVAAASKGARVSYRLSEAATATFRVERARPGRRVGRKCVRPTRRNKARRRCTRYVALRGSFSRAAGAGPNRFRFTGRLRGKKLRPGRYRLVLVAKDAVGNRSNAKRASFRIVRR